MPALFLLHLLPNHHQTWQDRTVTRNLSKASEILMTSSSSFRYLSKSKFEILYYLSDLVEILHKLQFYGADLEFLTKNSDINTI